MGESECREPPVFRCDAGTVVGFVDGAVVRATGIRYARADRFHPPTAEPPATEPVQATAPAAACPQARVALLDAVLNRPMGDLPHDEHCQRLSVAAPLGVAPGDRLPVMVWIHGGSYTGGAGDSPIYDPRPLVREQRVVVVTVTYRLGLFGYLGQAGGRPANLGLLDQLEALRWVQRNVAAFGGDPANVTVFGQSAGGDAVAHLMIAEGAGGLFRRVIIQSPPLGLALGREQMNAAMAEAAADIDPAASADEVVAAQQEVERRAAPFRLLAAMPFGTQYGLPPLPAEEQLDAAWTEVAPTVDVLIGSTDREIALFLPRAKALHRLTRVPLLGRAVRAVVVGILTRRVYADGIDTFAARHARAGGRVHRYLLTWGAPGNEFAGAHTVDLPLLFGDQAAWEPAALIAGADWTEVDRQGRVLRGLWADFARTGEAGPVHHPGLIRVTTLSERPR